MYTVSEQETMTQCCSAEQWLLSLACSDEATQTFRLSHLCTFSPCPSLAGPGSCDWLTAGLWSSSPDWPGPQQQTCMSAAPAHSTPARKRTAPRTRTAGRCSPPGQSLLSRLGQTDDPCRRGGSPSEHTSASDRKSLFHPVWQLWFTNSITTGLFGQSVTQILWCKLGG